MLELQALTPITVTGDDLDHYVCNRDTRYALCGHINPTGEVYDDANPNCVVCLDLAYTNVCPIKPVCDCNGI